jgi:hypothetical protein
LKERKGFELRPEGNNKWFCEREKNGKMAIQLLLTV